MSDQFLTPALSDDTCFSSPAHRKFTDFRKNSLVAVVHVGESNCVFTVYTAPDLKYVTSAQQKLNTNSPQADWFEQDPDEIIAAVYKTTYRGCSLLPSHGYIRSDIEAISITNQRETLVVWDERSGEPLYQAILANDTRATSIADDLISKLPNKDFTYFKAKCGLPVLPYFPALKIRWLQENVPAVKTAMKNGYCKVGTLDTWVIWKLSRGVLHITDVTNASRTLLMNISTMSWDSELLKAFSIEPAILPEIRSCAEVFGFVTTSLCVLKGIRIGGIIADHQATMLGQMCLHKGQIVANFDDGLNLLCNTGKLEVSSRELFTIVAYKLGVNAPCIYALEGVSPYCGSTINWVRKNLRIKSTDENIRVSSNVVSSPNHVFFVPALRGLQAPFWHKNARGTLIGLSEKTKGSHIVRAVLEAICFQVRDLLEAIKLTGENYQSVIYAGGEHASNTHLMQILADISGATVVNYDGKDSVSYGAAICAGRAVNIVDLQRFEQGIWRLSVDFETYVPLKRSAKTMIQYLRWRHAVSRSMRWTNVKQPSVSSITKHIKYLLLGSLLSAILIATSIYVLKKSRGVLVSH